jgi:hypothetical protein
LTAYAPTAPAPGPKLALVTLIVLAVHALLLLGLPHWARTVPVTGGPPAFQIRTIVLGPPQPAATETAPAPQPPKPKPRLKPPPTPVPAVDDPSVSALPDSPQIVNRSLGGTANPSNSSPLPVVTMSSAPLSSEPTDATVAHPSLLQAPPLAAFGGKVPLPPIVPPLPPDQALAVIQQAAQPTRASSAASETQTPGTPDPIPSVQLPRPAEITYQATLTQGKRLVALPSTINWRYDGQYYDLRWTLYGPAIGDRSRTATGLITVRGLAPVAAQAMGADAYSLDFDYAQSRLHGAPLPPPSTPGRAASAPLSAASAADSSASIPFPPGTQDASSALIELGALIAGKPSQYPVGSHIVLPVASGHNQAPQSTDFTIADDNDFSVAGQFSDQPLPALHLVHEPAGDHNARIELWLGKRLDYLPIRLLIVQPEGDRLDMTIQSAYTQTVPPSLPASAAGSAGAR